MNNKTKEELGRFRALLHNTDLIDPANFSFLAKELRNTLDAILGEE